MPSATVYIVHNVVDYVEISVSQQFLTHCDERERTVTFLTQEPYTFFIRGWFCKAHSISIIPGRCSSKSLPRPTSWEPWHRKFRAIPVLVCHHRQSAFSNLARVLPTYFTKQRMLFSRDKETRFLPVALWDYRVFDCMTCDQDTSVFTQMSYADERLVQRTCLVLLPIEMLWSNIYIAYHQSRRKLVYV